MYNYRQWVSGHHRCVQAGGEYFEKGAPLPLAFQESELEVKFECMHEQEGLSADSMLDCSKNLEHFCKNLFLVT